MHNGSHHFFLIIPLNMPKHISDNSGPLSLFTWVSQPAPELSQTSTHIPPSVSSNSSQAFSTLLPGLPVYLYGLMLSKTRGKEQKET